MQSQTTFYSKLILVACILVYHGSLILSFTLITIEIEGE